MAISPASVEGYSAYSHLTDEELLQVAVERSSADKCLPTDQRTSSSSSSPAPFLTQEYPNLRGRRLERTQHQSWHVPPFHTGPPESPYVTNGANPQTALSRCLYRAPEMELGLLQSVIVHGDTNAVMEMIGQGSTGLTKPNEEGWIALHEAAYYGQPQIVRILIKAHPESVNMCSLKNQTALFLAASRGHVSCVDLLLKHGADLNISNKERDTPLFKACEHPNEAIVELLLRSGAQVNRSCSHGGTALHEACRHGDVNLCRMLLDAGANLHTRNIYSIQPLFVAAQHGHDGIISLLVKRGADVNGRAGDGASPLYEACKNGHVSAVETLLSLKADANRPTKSGLMPLHVAVQNNHKRIVSKLILVTSRVRLQHSGISPLHVAADKNRNDILELLIDSGLNVNAKLSGERSRLFKDRRSTALYFSVYNRNLEAAEMLLQAGANPNLDILNPLLIAVQLDCIDMAALLLKYGADVNAQLSMHPSSFPSAILLGLGNLCMIKLLLDYGCNARPCFDCLHGQSPHPAASPLHRPIEETHISRDVSPKPPIQFCEAVCSSSLCRIIGPTVSLILDYVPHIRFCCRLVEALEKCSDWEHVKLKAFPPHPLMQLCRLKIRHLVGVQRLCRLNTLPLPARIIRFLHYDVHCSLA